MENVLLVRLVLAVAADFEAPGDFATSLELMNSRGDDKPVEATTFDRHPRGRCAAVDYSYRTYFRWLWICPAPFAPLPSCLSLCFCRSFGCATPPIHVLCAQYQVPVLSM